jgi:hypothetical protein
MSLGRRGAFAARAAAILGLLCGGVVTLACGNTRDSGVPSSGFSLNPTAAPSPVPIPVPDAVLVGAGDIAMCGSAGLDATATLLDSIPGTVFAAGDNAYPNGSAQDYANCYEPSWGRHKYRTRPVPGNHEYQTPGAAGYFNYFGANAGSPGRSYYSYREGAWLVIALDSNIAMGSGSPQAEWLRRLLAAEPTPCTLAYWHHPLFTSGPNGQNNGVRELWRILYDGGAEIVLSGHDHLYERFAPQDADGRLDAERGLRQFVVGTGGAYLYEAKTRRPNSEVVGRAHGVLKLTLKGTSYDWQFVPVPGASFADSGSGTCH